VVVLETILIVGFMVSGKDYAPLLTNVPSEQVSTIVEKLNAKNVPFQLKDDGKTILVPRDLLHATQMTLMSEIASPKLGNIGLEIF